MPNHIYGISMMINLRCSRCEDPLEATVLRPRSHEHGDVVVSVEACEKCMKAIVAEGAAYAATHQGGGTA
jgi:hypothetical protein